MKSFAENVIGFEKNRTPYLRPLYHKTTQFARYLDSFSLRCFSKPTLMSNSLTNRQVYAIITISEKCLRLKGIKNMRLVKYLGADSPGITRTLTCVALAIAIVSLALVAYMGYRTVFGSILDIPGLGIFLDELNIQETKDSLRELLDVMDTTMEEMDEEIASMSPSERAEIEEKMGMEIEKFRDLLIRETIKVDFSLETDLEYEEIREVVEVFSLHSVMNLFEQIPEVNEAERFQYFKLIYLGLIGVFVFLGLLIALSALFLRKWILILEFILAAGIYYIFGGGVMLAILFALLIAYCVVLSVAKSKWKEYQMDEGDN